MTRNVRLALAFGLLAATTASGEDSYTIKLKKPAKGASLLVERNSTIRSEETQSDAKGKKLEELKEFTTETFVYKETILEKAEGAKQATRLRRHYDKAQIKKDKETETLPYEGKTVVIEKKGETYQFQIEGGTELKGIDALRLEEEFNSDKASKLDVEDLVLPGKAVRLNETWKIDEKALAKYLKAEGFEPDRVSGTAKFVRAYKHDGHQFGVVEMRLELGVKGILDDERKTTVDKGSKSVVELTFDGCIDGASSTMRTKGMMKVNFGGEFTGPDGTKIKLSVAEEIKEDESIKEVPGK